MWKIGQLLPTGEDAGLVNAKRVWAEKLAGFAEHPECIKHVLAALPDDPPTLPHFVELCRKAPRKEAPALPYKPTPEDEERAKEHINRAASALKGKLKDGIDVHWATHPRSDMHLQFIFDAAKKDARFKPCIEEMVSKGICTDDGKLLKRYSTGAWTSA
jgi:hypothetical protein